MSHWTRVWIPLGAGLFIFALVGSAVAVPQLRLLHLFQALIYVAVILLARRNYASGRMDLAARRTPNPAKKRRKSKVARPVKRRTNSK